MIYSFQGVDCQICGRSRGGGGGGGGGGRQTLSDQINQPSTFAPREGFGSWHFRQSNEYTCCPCFFLQNHNLLKNLHCWNITFTDTKLISDFYTNIYKRVSQGNKSLIIRKQWSCCNIFNIFLTMYNMYTLCGYFAFPIFTECHLNTYFSVGFSGVQDQNPVSWMRILKLKKNSGRKVWREPKFGELDPVFLRWLHKKSSFCWRSQLLTFEILTQIEASKGSSWMVGRYWARHQMNAKRTLSKGWRLVG